MMCENCLANHTRTALNVYERHENGIMRLGFSSVHLNTAAATSNPFTCRASRACRNREPSNSQHTIDLENQSENGLTGLARINIHTYNQFKSAPHKRPRIWSRELICISFRVPALVVVLLSKADNRLLLKIENPLIRPICVGRK